MHPQVVAFDSVDDESQAEPKIFQKFPIPEEWAMRKNPPYSYYLCCECFIDIRPSLHFRHVHEPLHLELHEGEGPTV